MIAPTTTATQTIPDLLIVSRIDESGCEVTLSPQQERFNEAICAQVDRDLARLRGLALVRRAHREASRSLREGPAIPATPAAGLPGARVMSRTPGHTFGAPVCSVPELDGTV